MANRTDNFDRTNSTTSINPPSDGGANWAPDAGANWGINSNHGYCPISNTGACVLDGGFSTMDVQATFTTFASDTGLAARHADAGNHLNCTVRTGQIQIYKVVSSSFISLSNQTGLTIANGDVIKFTVDSANLISAFQNGTPRGTATDAAGAANTKGGLFSNVDGGMAWDDFSLTNNAVSAAITGTATASITETDVVAGGKTVVITLTGNTFIAS